MLIASAPAATAIPVVFSNPSGTPTFDAAAIPAGGIPHALDIWFDAGEGYYDFSITLVASVGLDLDAFLPNAALSPTVSLTTGESGTLVLIDSNSFFLRSGPIHVGTLSVSGALFGATLALADLPAALSPSFTDASFGVVAIPVPHIVAVVVPEPATAILLGIGLATMSARRGRTRRRPKR